jgi:hypothetical protein
MVGYPGPTKRHHNFPQQVLYLFSYEKACKRFRGRGLVWPTLHQVDITIPDPINIQASLDHHDAVLNRTKHFSALQTTGFGDHCEPSVSLERVIPWMHSLIEDTR